jgi:hypothetical protein
MKIVTSRGDLSIFNIIKEVEAKTITFTETNCYQGQKELIQSLLMEIPMNPFYFLQDRKANYSVIDGNWRLENIVNYMKSKLFLDLSGREQRRLEDYLWPINVIQYSFDRTDADVNEIKNMLHFNWRNL